MVCTVAYIKKHIRLLHMIGGGGVNVALFSTLSSQCFKHTVLLVWQTNTIYVLKLSKKTVQKSYLNYHQILTSSCYTAWIVANTSTWSSKSHQVEAAPFIP